MSVETVADECKHCTDSDEKPLPGEKLGKGLPNGDQMYRCLRCNRMWGVNKNGERIDG